MSMSRDQAARHPAVLIVENDGNERRLFEAAFALSGFGTIESENAEDAFDVAASRRPCLSIVDLHIAGASGMDLITRLRCDERTAEIPLLAVTAPFEGDIRSSVAHAGADAVLVKPVTPHDIVATGRLLIERGMLLRECARRGVVAASEVAARSEDHPAESAPPPDASQAMRQQPDDTSVSDAAPVRCRFCGTSSVELVRSTAQSTVYYCLACRKNWRRSRR
jgi:DNA-binding response OmpR family regulator